MATRPAECLYNPAVKLMLSIWKTFLGSLRRVFPAALTDAQAIAFSMFLSFFPLLLFALGLLAISTRVTSAAQDFFTDLRMILPPESKRMVLEYLALRVRGKGPETWTLVGIGGTLLGGTAMMTGFMQGFRNIYRDPPPRYWRNQLRGFCLLLVTFIPVLFAITLTVFGRQFRTWTIVHFGLPKLFQLLWAFISLGLALVVAVLVLAVMYRVGRSGSRNWNDVIPGAVVATLLWWLVNSAFGYYVRQVPYSRVYGGLAAAIGLMVWMNLCAIVVLLGAAYNATLLDNRRR